MEEEILPSLLTSFPSARQECAPLLSERYIERNGLFSTENTAKVNSFIKKFYEFCHVARTLAHKRTLINQLIFTILTLFNFEKNKVLESLSI